MNGERSAPTPGSRAPRAPAPCPLGRARAPGSAAAARLFLSNFLAGLSVSGRASSWEGGSHPEPHHHLLEV
ncbi:hypothetical protein NDU88_001527 [Pleurodeles waltl]|uniref:Uncharacterized protein n=1 Tax=Pleurodeles waltl TaxID=8319 RepID=A0AAV7SZW3_PLEWA|nr:hypothetical protein NDU88_001527 [Pleurodeles waltl]